MRKVFMALSLWVLPAIAASGNTLPAHDIIRAQARSLYATAEQTGGSLEEWAAIEQDALDALSALATADPVSLVQQNEKGQTALMIAAARGYHLIVAALLKSPQVKSDISATDDLGLSAYGYALLSKSTALRGCHPDARNPFLLVPFLVQLPYFADRDPYPAILASLRLAGAGHDETAAKQVWLETCSNKNPDARRMVRESPNLYLTLQEIAEMTAKEHSLIESRKQENTLRQLLSGSVKSGRMTEEELEAAIADVYRKRGLDPALMQGPEAGKE